jgi:nicotinate-nucleotide pyrophosphorylase (carboxylating)
MTASNRSFDQQLSDFIERALQEDVGPGDITSLACIPADKTSKAKLLAKDPGVLAGVAVAKAVFARVDPQATLKVFLEDGAFIHHGDIVFEVTCNTRALLQAERLVLNVMQRMSGIATLSNQFHFEVEDLPVVLLDTRKTTPLLRFLERQAVHIGGCQNYRSGLYDRFLIKDNHIDASGGVKAAIQQVLDYRETQGMDDYKITVEVRNLVELSEVLEIGQVDRIMLDNFELTLLKEAVVVVDGRFETEASGGVTLHNVRKVAQTGVDFISIGALTHSSTSLDLSLKIAD